MKVKTKKSTLTGVEGVKCAYCLSRKTVYDKGMDEAFCLDCGKFS